MEELVQRVAERHSALASTLSSLKATKIETNELHEVVQSKLAALKAANAAGGSEWRTKVIEGTTASSLEDAAAALETHTEAARLEEQRLVARNADLRSKLAALTASKEAALEEAAALEESLGEGAEASASPQTGNKKKRSAEVADLLAGNQEAAEAQEWFTAMTQVCEVLGGVTVESCSEVKAAASAAAFAEVADDDEEGKSSSILVKLKLWAVHSLSLTLACGGTGRDVLQSAELVAHFEDSGVSGSVVAVDDLLVLAKGLPPPQDVQLLVRESLARLAAWPERKQHLDALKSDRKFTVKSSRGGALVTMPCGVICALRLSPDYPRSAGAVVVEGLVGADSGWFDKDLAKLRDHLAATQWRTVSQLFDVLEARLAQGADRSS